MRLELDPKPDIWQWAGEQPPIETPQLAIESHMTIGMAIGIVMHRYSMSGERALAYLENVAHSSKINLPALAQQMVDEANGPARGAD
jgi:AmiR/NasT family two-component response regulator